MGCSDSPASSPTPAALSARPTATAMATPTPIPTPTPVVPFDQILSGNNLARFQALPAELRNALFAESLENGNERALEYLRDMPVDAVPIAEILTPEVLTTFDSLREAVQRRLLLEGYPNSTMRQFETRWRDGNLSDVEYQYGWLEHMVQTTYKLLTVRGELLPPIEETLSQTALEKLDDLNPLLQKSFRLVWENTRIHSTINPTGKLESNLLNMPPEMPGIHSLGLPFEVVGVLDREPKLEGIALQIVAADPVRSQE